MRESIVATGLSVEKIGDIKIQKNAELIPIDDLEFSQNDWTIDYFFVKS